MTKIKLLLVDDEEDYVKTMAERMEMRDVGSRVALSGEEALEMVEDEAPDVMILDLRMPGIDGMEVLERVKTSHPRIQVVILTGHGSESEEEEARRLGAFDYVRKPADTSRLLRTVRAAWKVALSFLEESSEELTKSMTAAAFAEAGAPEIAEEMMRRTEPGAPEAGPGRAGGDSARNAPPLKVLLVDDEEDFVTTMADRMQMRELGSEVALSGEQAIEMLEQDTPDVVVLDLRMPGMGGMEVLRRLKQAHPKVEVIIMTGHGSEEDEQEAFRLGAFAYLTKPVELDQLVRKIRRAGQRRRAAE